MTAQVKPQRILVIVGSLNRGGTERHLLQTLSALDRTRFSIEVFTLVEARVLGDSMRALGIPVHAPWLRGGLSRNPLYQIARLLLVALQLWLFMLRWRPEVAHCFLPASYLIGAPAAFLAGVRVRVMSRCSLNYYQQSRPIAGARESEAIAIALARLPSDGGLRTRVGRAARARVHASFSRARCVDAYSHRYDTLCSGRSMSGLQNSGSEQHAEGGDEI